MYYNVIMEKKRSKSETKKDYWANIPKIERSRRARLAALAKQKGLTKEQRLEHSKKMTKALKEKILLRNNNV